jgi:hypothetical protein
MNPDKVVEHPACCRVLDALTFLIRKGQRMLLQGGANPILQGTYTNKQMVMTINPTTTFVSHGAILVP